mgnify:CR=1 FL=1
MRRLTVEGYANYLQNVIGKISAEKEYITGLDSVLGDGDHWANLMVGFNRILEQIDELKKCDFETLFKQIGKIFLNSSGGSSGILYCSAYLSAAPYLKGKDEISVSDLAEILRLEQKGIEARGGAKPGDKTMLDTLAAAAAAAGGDGGSEDDLLRRISAGAYEGMSSTKDMEARKGRACYRKDKGVGHIDPGAVTMYYQIEYLVMEFLR